MTGKTEKSGKNHSKPAKDELEKLIDEIGYRDTGKKFGVADNTIRRWAMAYGILLKPKCVLKARERRNMENVDGKIMWEEDVVIKKQKEEAKKERKAKYPDAGSKPNTRSKKSRYSESELQEFRVKIEEKIREGFEAICILKETLSHKSENGTDDTASSGNLFDEGTAAVERENMTELVAKKQKHLNALNAAIVRIGNGTYGICVETGKLIPKERLIAVPHATKCVEAKKASDDGKVKPQHQEQEAGESEV